MRVHRIRRLTLQEEIDYYFHMQSSHSKCICCGKVFNDDITDIHHMPKEKAECPDGRNLTLREQLNPSKPIDCYDFTPIAYNPMED